MGQVKKGRMIDVGAPYSILYLLKRISQPRQVHQLPRFDNQLSSFSFYFKKMHR